MAGPSRWCSVLVLTLGLGALWISALFVPLYPPDEGRYSSAAMHMADGGGWLIPVLDGKPHLTKPPLAYWAQAVCLRALGHNEAAVRLPSLVASSLTVLLLWWMGSRLGGPRVGLLAAACLCITPLFISVGRLAITDPLLNLIWFSALAFGYLAIQTGFKRWAALTWLAVSLGLMTKGPLALSPVGLLVLWLALAKAQVNKSTSQQVKSEQSAHRYVDCRLVPALRRLRLGWGLPLALLPLAGWAALVVRAHPDAFSIWWQQIIGRTVGTGDHNEPFWYYGPVFLAGLLPGTAMLVLPGWNIPWRQARTRLQAADPACFWALAVVVPLVMFSLMSGKLAHYLLPLCAPMALLTAMTLERWLSGEADTPAPGTRPAGGPAVITIVAAVLALGALGSGLWLDWRRAWMALPIFLPVIACAWTWRVWTRQPHRRGFGLAAAWLAAIFAWLWVFQVDRIIRRPICAKELVARLQTMTGAPRPRILIYGFKDPTIAFYAHRQSIVVQAERDITEALEDNPQDLVLLADAKDWDDFVKVNPACGTALVRVGEFKLWVRRTVLLLRPAEQVPDMVNR